MGSNGAGSSRQGMLSQSIQYAKMGAVCLAIDAAMSGSRAIPGEQFLGLAAGDIEGLTYEALGNHLFLKPKAPMILTNLIALGFAGVMSWQLWLYAVFLFGKGDTTQVWTVPLWPIAFAVAVGSIFIVTGLLLHVAGVFRRLSGEVPVPLPAAPEANALFSPE